MVCETQAVINFVIRGNYGKTEVYRRVVNMKFNHVISPERTHDIGSVKITRAHTVPPRDYHSVTASIEVSVPFHLSQGESVMVQATQMVENHLRQQLGNALEYHKANF